jgi:hypothetical protein
MEKQGAPICATSLPMIDTNDEMMNAYRGAYPIFQPFDLALKASVPPHKEGAQQHCRRDAGTEHQRHQ